MNLHQLNDRLERPAASIIRKGLSDESPAMMERVACPFSASLKLRIAIVPDQSLSGASDGFANWTILSAREDRKLPCVILMTMDGKGSLSARFAERGALTTG